MFVVWLQVKVTNGKHLINLLEGDGWLTSRPTINLPPLIGNPKRFFFGFRPPTIIPEIFLNLLNFIWDKVKYIYVQRIDQETSAGCLIVDAQLKH